MKILIPLAAVAALVAWLAVSVGGRETGGAADVPTAAEVPAAEEPEAVGPAGGEAQVREAATESPGGVELAADEEADGEPEYHWAGSYEMGTYRSMEEIYAEAAARILLKISEDWVEQQADWVVDDKRYEKVPVFYFLEDRPIPDQATLDALYAEIEAVDEVVRDQAREAHRLYRASALDYARNRMKRYPRGSNGEPLTQEFLDTYAGSRYAASAGLTAGRWYYDIDFRSKMYPELEGALDVLDELAAEKVAIAERYLK